MKKYFLVFAFTTLLFQPVFYEGHYWIGNAKGASIQSLIKDLKTGRDKLDVIGRLRELILKAIENAGIESRATAAQLEQTALTILDNLENSVNAGFDRFDDSQKKLTESLENLINSIDNKAEDQIRHAAQQARATLGNAVISRDIPQLIGLNSYYVPIGEETTQIKIEGHFPMHAIENIYLKVNDQTEFQGLKVNDGLSFDVRLPDNQTFFENIISGPTNGNWSASRNSTNVHVFPPLELGLMNKNVNVRWCSTGSVETTYKVEYIGQDGENKEYKFTTNSAWCAKIVANNITVLNTGGDGVSGTYEILSGCLDEEFSFTMPEFPNRYLHDNIKAILEDEKEINGQLLLRSLENKIVRICTRGASTEVNFLYTSADNEVSSLNLNNTGNVEHCSLLPAVANTLTVNRAGEAINIRIETQNISAVQPKRIYPELTIHYKPNSLYNWVFGWIYPDVKIANWTLLMEILPSNAGVLKYTKNGARHHACLSWGSSKNIRGIENVIYIDPFGHVHTITRTDEFKSEYLTKNVNVMSFRTPPN